MSHVNLVVLEGSDGVGKSSIADAVQNLVEASGAQVLRTGRKEPLGPPELGGLVRGVQEVFGVSEALELPIPYLGLLAASQHQSLIQGVSILGRHSSVSPIVVLADSWWNKTVARFAVDLRSQGHSAQAATELVVWMERLMENHPPSVRQLTILICADRADRMAWYAASETRQRVFDADGRPSTAADDFGDYTERVQRFLRMKAEKEAWPVVTNRRGELSTTAAHVHSLVMAQL